MLQPDTLLGTYRLIEKIGAGGMGEVWKGEDTRLGRLVAIKILPQAIAADVQAIARMKREARTAAQIYHPNIATIHAFEEAGDRIFIVMEYVEGQPLSALIERGPVPEADVCRIGRSVADALAEAHEKGIVHRDIKPDNIVVNGPRVKVLDFGIAKQIGPQTVGAHDPTTVLTQQGMIIGTVSYMSPEQALGKPLDPRTDLFSLGVVLYEAVTGRRPFAGDSATDTITRIVRDEAPIPSHVSRGLAAVIATLLRKNREERFATAREVVSALDAQLAVAPTAPYTRSPAPRMTAPPTVITAPHAQKKAPSWLWIVAAALVVLGAMLYAFSARQKKEEPAPKPAPAATMTQPPVTTSSVASAEQTVTATPVLVEQTRSEAQETRVTAEPAAPAQAPAQVPVRTADDDYNEGLARLVEWQPMLARDSFQSAVAKDPHHARAHFRLGEMALFLRDTATARRELDAAMADADRLDARERKLTELGLALLDGDRLGAQALLQEIQSMSPGDPDLMRFRQLLLEMRGEQRQPFRRGRLRPH